MPVMEDQYQQALLECVKPLIRSLPESKKVISWHTGVPVSSLNGFMTGKSRLTLPELQAISDYFHCEYKFLEWDDGHYFHSFTLKGGYTSFPKTKKAIVDLYDSVSNGGDLVLACEIANNVCFIQPNERILLLHTCFFVYNLIIVVNLCEELDSLIESDKLINFDGFRIAGDSLLSSIQSHYLDIREDPGNRRSLDYAFFRDKDMVFEQLQLSQYISD